jgi:glycosyltransferase 2 family protein
VRRGAKDRLIRLLANPWVRVAAVALPVGVSLINLARVPSVELLPLLPAVALYIVGKYLLCPLRWHAVTRGGLTRGWHVRAYAEGELLGLAAPAHVAADLWRANRLIRAGLTPGHTARAIALDRGIGAVGLGLGGAAVGVMLPPAVLVAVAAAAAAALLAAWLLRVRRRLRGDDVSRPTWRVLCVGLGLSVLYQACAAAFLLGVVTAVHEPVSPLRLAAIYAASQLAGVIPGWSGLSARDGALAASLTTLGLPWAAALGSVALAALIAWIPALVLGGTSLFARWIDARIHP